MSAPLAPTSRARRTDSIVSRVLLLPAPATTGTRPFTSSTTTAMARARSSASMVTASPVVPMGSSTFVPPSSWKRTRARKASSSSAPSWNGVASAVMEPSKVFMPALIRSGPLAAPEVLDALALPHDTPGRSVHQHLRRPGPRVVGGSHAHPVSPGAHEGVQVVLAGQHQGARPCEHVRGLTHRPHDVHLHVPAAA